ncbi:MAG: copper ion binding protein [Clostridiales Family XIII bacterium]|jgi:copper chaperone|nr:copper ion binding protein [Clostridiales Family XIII bacterium]
MEESVIGVEGMSCEHCVKAITGAVGALPGVGGVSVDLEAKTVTVTHDPALSAADRIRAEIEDQGYDVLG